MRDSYWLTEWQLASYSMCEINELFLLPDEPRKSPLNNGVLASIEVKPSAVMSSGHPGLCFYHIFGGWNNKEIWSHSLVMDCPCMFFQVSKKKALIRENSFMPNPFKMSICRLMRICQVPWHILAQKNHWAPENTFLSVMPTDIKHEKPLFKKKNHSPFLVINILTGGVDVPMSYVFD